MVVFVVLHYCGLNDTIKCIESLLVNLNNRQFKIVVVDNCSPDDSGQNLICKYDTNNLVHIILNNNNYGFSKGNNIGCEYAIENYHPDFIGVINNDTYIEDKFFIDKIYESYNQNHFDIMGPRIWNVKRRYNQNPITVISTIDEIEEELLSNNLSQKLLFSKLPILYYLYNRFIRKYKYSHPKRELGLHGAALIFSATYYNKFHNVFPEVTFMYGEENLLFYRKMKDDLILLYDSNIEIFHNHSSSTKVISKSIVDKWKFQNRYITDALYKLRDIYSNNIEI